MKLYTVCWKDTMEPIEGDSLRGWPGLRHMTIGSKDATYASMDKMKETAVKYFPDIAAMYESRGLIVAAVELKP